jgi:hypothetical protein
VDTKKAFILVGLQGDSGPLVTPFICVTDDGISKFFISEEYAEKVKARLLSEYPNHMYTTYSIDVPLNTHLSEDEE